MNNLEVLVPLNTAPLSTVDEVVVKRQGDDSASRAPAGALPISTAVSQALDALETTAANDATQKADAARGAAIAAIPTSTDGLAEGTTNPNRRYFTEQRVRDTTLGTLPTAPASAIAPADKTVEALAKLQAQQSATAAVASAALPATARGAQQGVAPLVDGQVPSMFIPGAQDEIIEANTFAEFPVTGSVNKIYLALDTGRLYRWGGTTYAEVSPSPGSTDEVPEGPSGTRRYFTEERVNTTQISDMTLTATSATIQNGESLRVILGKLQGQLTNAINGFANRVLTTALDGISFLSDAQVTATTVIRDAIGRLQAQVNGKLGRRVGDGTDMTFGNVGDLQLVQRQGSQFVGIDSISDTSYTLATRPPPAGVPDDVIRLKGVGNARSVWQESNGVNWGMQNGHAVIWLDSFPASKALTPMTGALVDLPDSYTLPGNLLNENSQVRIRPRFVAANPTGTNQVQVLVNGSPVYESTAGNWWQQMGEIRFNNLGAMNAQEFFGPGTTGTGLGNSNSNQYSNPAGSPGSLRTFDTTADLTITFKAVGASGTSIKLAGFVLEVFDR